MIFRLGSTSPRSAFLFICNVFLFLFHAVLGEIGPDGGHRHCISPVSLLPKVAIDPAPISGNSFPLPHSITRFNFLFRSRQRTRYHHTSIHHSYKRRYHSSR